MIGKTILHYEILEQNFLPPGKVGEALLRLSFVRQGGPNFAKATLGKPARRLVLQSFSVGGSFNKFLGEINDR